MNRFAAAGHPIVAAGRRSDRLQALVAELGEDHVHLVELDVHDRRAVEDAIAALPSSFSTVDVLVGNAGPSVGLEPAQTADLDGWNAMVDTNVTSLSYIT